MTKISKFPTYRSKPKVTTIEKVICASMDSNNKLARQVQEYRNKLQSLIEGGLSVDEAKEKIDYLKKSFPLVTFGCLLTGKRDEEEYEKPGTGYRKKEQIKERTGWIALDIDAKDNPHLDDAEAVRDAIGRLPFVAFSALSVSGMGVWALVKVDPQKQAQHFEQLQKDFEYYGIRLDSTKGKHPHDLRYYSFDPDAVINKDFQIYDRLPKEKPKLSRPTVNRSQIEHSDKYAEAALNDEIDTLSRTTNGNRNNQLFKSTAALAQLVAGGVLGKSEVADALFNTARSIGLPKYEIETTINSGFRAGMENPRQPAKNSHTKLLRKKDNGANGKSETNNLKNNEDEPKDFNLSIEGFNRRYGSYPSAPF